jgi:hypothetical protein
MHCSSFTEIWVFDKALQQDKSKNHFLKQKVNMLQGTDKHVGANACQLSGYHIDMKEIMIHHLALSEPGNCNTLVHI